MSRGRWVVGGLFSSLCRLAYTKPALRAHLVPILRKHAVLGKRGVRLRDFERMLAQPGEFGIMTAYGPGSKSLNKALQGELLRDLQRLGYRYEHLKGKWEGLTEKSLLIPDVRAADLFALGRKYNQISVIHKNRSGVVGMYYLREGSVEIALRADSSIAGEATPGQDLWSKSRGNSFSFEFLWGQRLPWDGRSAVDKNQVLGWVRAGLLRPAAAP